MRWHGRKGPSSFRPTGSLAPVSRRIELEISESVWSELQRRRRETGYDLSRLVDSTLCDAFDLDVHSLFQVSTSNALVQGVFAGAVTVGELRRHGDFGLGTFTGLDGELIMIEGQTFRATVAGVVTVVSDDREVPFALVTRFVGDTSRTVEPVPDLESLTNELDRLRPSQNLFAGIRVDARFDSLVMRAACPARPGEGLAEATHHQSEFEATGVPGTLVGFWAPEYARAVGVPGFHFHFISADRSLGGHLLELSARSAEVELQTESRFHLAIPETAEFLRADLSGDHQEALAEAETRSLRAAGDP